MYKNISILIGNLIFRKIRSFNKYQLYLFPGIIHNIVFFKRFYAEGISFFYPIFHIIN
ncbi:hypothetical protein ES708_05440 [subsurface metagenome]